MYVLKKGEQGKIRRKKKRSILIKKEGKGEHKLKSNFYFRLFYK
ncbi:hypothetical protein ES703_92575 [subsurface metagenome]